MAICTLPAAAASNDHGAAVPVANAVPADEVPPCVFATGTNTALRLVNLLTRYVPPATSVAMIDISLVTTDTSGNIYVTGFVNVASSKIYILKYNSSGVLQWIKTITHSTRALFARNIFWIGGNLHIAANNDNSQHVIVKLADTGGTNGTYGSYTIATVTTGYTTLTGSVTNTTTGMTNTSRTVVATAALGATQSTPSYTSTITTL